MSLVITIARPYIPDTFTSLSNPNPLGMGMNENIGAVTLQTSNPLGMGVSEDMGAITSQTSNPLGMGITD